MIDLVIDMTKRVRNTKQYKGIRKNQKTKVEYVYIDPDNRVSPATIVLMVSIGIAVLAALIVGVLAFANRPVEVKSETASELDKMLEEASPENLLVCEFVDKDGTFIEVANSFTNIGISVNAKDIKMEMKYLFVADELYLMRNSIYIHARNRQLAESYFQIYREYYSASSQLSGEYDDRLTSVNHKVSGNDIVTTVDYTGLIIRKGIQRIIDEEGNDLGDDEIEALYDTAIGEAGIGLKKEELMEEESFKKALASGAIKCNE